MPPATFGPIRQVAWLTEDLSSTMASWTRLAGVGPWTCYRNVVMAGRFRGQASDVKIHVGLAYQGELQIELIEPVSTGASPYLGPDGRALVGMHHVAWVSADFEADVETARGRGLAVLFEAKTPAGRVAYLENEGAPGLLLEFIEGTPQLLQTFAEGMAAARGWDGGDPVRTIDFGLL